MRGGIIVQSPQRPASQQDNRKGQVLMAERENVSSPYHSGPCVDVDHASVGMPSLYAVSGLVGPSYSDAGACAIGGLRCRRGV